MFELTKEEEEVYQDYRKGKITIETNSPEVQAVFNSLVTKAETAFQTLNDEGDKLEDFEDDLLKWFMGRKEKNDQNMNHGGTSTSGN